MATANAVNVEWAAVISWNHSDGVVRVKNKKGQAAINFLHWTARDQVKTLICICVI